MKLTILQWNVWYREQADNILSFIKSVDADIVCLQELTQESFMNEGRNMPGEIAALGYHSAYSVALTRIERAPIRMGNGIFCKFPVHASRVITVQDEDINLKRLDHERRIYIEATLQLPDTMLTVGTTHLSFTDNFEENWHKQEEINRLHKAISKPTDRFVFTGDLNALPHSKTVHMLEEFLVHAGPAYAEPTWTTKPVAYQNFEASGLGWRMDYVFATPNVKVVDSKLLQTDYSDHLPILTTIDV